MNDSSFRHLCTGSLTLEFMRDGELIGSLGLHHGEIVRMDGWTSDARIDEPLPLLRWLSRHGVTGPLEEVERAQEIQARSAEAHAAWLRAMPPALRPHVEQLEQCMASCPDREERFDGALAALRRSGASEAEIAEQLATWYGSGRGEWSGYPNYESVAEELLTLLGSAALLEALQNRQLSARAWVGAGRFYAMRAVDEANQSEIDAVPAQVRHHMLEQVRHYQATHPRSQSWHDKPVDRLEQAFEE